MTIGQNIKSIRKEKGINQKRFAEIIGITVSGLQKIEYDEIKPKQDTLVKIAEALGVTVADLDDTLKDLFNQWNESTDVDSLQQEAKIFDDLPEYDLDDIEVFRQFLLLNPDGKKQASEYIDFLMHKQTKTDTHS